MSRASRLMVAVGALAALWSSPGILTQDGFAGVERTGIAVARQREPDPPPPPPRPRGGFGGWFAVRKMPPDPPMPKPKPKRSDATRLV